MLLLISIGRFTYIPGMCGTVFIDAANLSSEKEHSR